jgi:hypothetical protein
MQLQNSRSLWDISSWGNDENHSWLCWGIASLPPDLEEEWNILKSWLQGKSPLQKGEKDKRGWGHCSGMYTTAAGYLHITSVPHVPPDPTIWKEVWKTKSIPKIDMFTWTLAHKGILTGKNLRRRGWEGPSRCPFCSQEEETIDHLLLGFPYAREVSGSPLGNPNPS